MALVDVSDALDGLFTDVYTIRRQVSRSYTTGRLDTASPDDSTTIEACIQPNPDAEQVRDPEGNYRVQRYDVYTRSRVEPISDSYEGDTILIEDSWYLITHLKDWYVLGGYYLATAELVQV